MPTVLLLDEHDDKVPSEFVRVRCERCAELGWLHPNQVHLPWIDMLCVHCYSKRLKGEE